MILALLKPAMATGVVTAALTVYFAVHLNAGAIVVYQASGDFVRALPYVTWFFPLVAFHQFTNFGWYKRPINVFVSLSPLPTAAYMLAHPVDPLATATLDAIVTFLFSFLAFVLFLGHFTRHREEEIGRAARADEADRSAAVLRVSDERFRMLALATNDLIWDADLRTGRTWWSESLLNTYGYDPQESGADPKSPDDHSGERRDPRGPPRDRSGIVRTGQRSIPGGGTRGSADQPSTLVRAAAAAFAGAPSPGRVAGRNRGIDPPHHR